MAPRRGLFQRIGQAVRGIARAVVPRLPERPRREPPEPPERPRGRRPDFFPPEPPREPPREPPSRGRWREIFDRALRDEDGRSPALDAIYERTGYSRQEIFQNHYNDVFYPLTIDAPELTRDEQLEMWQDYIETFMMNEHRHDWFFETWNVHPSDFDWQAWREAMGYREK